MVSFLGGLFLLSASTMVYEIMLTRLLSVLTWYYLALVAVGMAMSGMTAGALVVQLYPDFFDEVRRPRRLRQAAFATALSIPIALLTMLAVPVAVALSIEVVYSFLLFTAFAALPFFFAGIAICLALTRSSLPIGRVYLADLIGASAGCLLSIGLIGPLGAPGAIFGCSALAFLSAAAFAAASGEGGLIRRNLAGALIIAIVAILNASTFRGFQPIWTKGNLDTRTHMIAEIWNPISRVKATGPYMNGDTYLFGPSPKITGATTPYIDLTIDSFASTPLYQRKPGGPSQFAFLNYDVTSFAYLLRKGGSAAIIGCGGGRDALAAWVNGFKRIEGVEVNGAIVDLDLRRLGWWSGLNDVPGFVLHNDEGRSFLTRSIDKFDVIQASMIDTEAATAAGAMTMTENSLYTVEAWRIFYEHLAPAGMLTFSRWAPPDSAQITETLRIFSLAWDTLLHEGVANPAPHLALIRSGQIATLLVSNAPFSADDLGRIQSLAEQMEYEILYLPGRAPALSELASILATKTSTDLSGLRYLGYLDFSPVHDSSPFFFNFIRPSELPRASMAVFHSGIGGNAQALVFLLMFTLASLALLAITVAVPLTPMAHQRRRLDRTMLAAIVYFAAIGLGFMLAEAALMQQLTLLLGTPAYSLVTVLAGLVFFAGIGSLASDRFSLRIRTLPPLASAIVLLSLGGILLPVVHQFASAGFADRVVLALAIVLLPGVATGGCFPVGLRWLKSRGRDEMLPWMWALNGAASVAATFAALLLSMQVSIAATLSASGICYAIAFCAIAFRDDGVPMASTADS